MNRNKELRDYRKRVPWKFTLYTIRQRCNNPNNSHYKWYGGRGIECYITEEELKYLWFRDEAGVMEEPSIDRKDNDGDYTFENCRYIEKDINTSNAKKRKVLQFDLEGNFIREFESNLEAESVTGIKNRMISRVALGQRKQTHGFVWKYKND